MNRTRTLCRYTIVVLALIFLTCPHVFANGDTTQANRDTTQSEDGWSWWLEDRGYYNPLIAEIRSANINVMFPGWSNEFPFMQKDGDRLVWDISLGKEIPLFGASTLKNYKADKKKWWPKGNWGLGFWGAASFHMIEDFKDESNPIVNTDYRFSGMFKIKYAWTDSKQFGFRLQEGHESTHLGDEFIIAAMEDSSFKRVNVSYEYREWGLYYDWRSSKGEEFSLRVGAIGLRNKCKGFYSEEVLFPDGQTLKRSRRNSEFTIGLEYINHVTLDKYLKCLKYLMPLFYEGGQWKPFLSMELRNRTVYDYDRKSSEEEEDNQWSVNLLVGIKVTEQESLPFGFYFRVYHGVNPHGQFRSQKDYILYGLGLHLSR